MPCTVQTIHIYCCVGPRYWIVGHTIFKQLLFLHSLPIGFKNSKCDRKMLKKYCVKFCKIPPGSLWLCTSNSFTIFLTTQYILYMYLKIFVIYLHTCRKISCVTHERLIIMTHFWCFLELVFAVLQTFFCWKFKWFDLKTAESLNFEWMINDWRSSLLN